ncbi:MAG: acyl-CoA thioesterase [Solirubrobacteraceae bacterium]
MSRIALRWRDFDPLGHVNSAIHLTFLETGRDRWLGEALGDRAGSRYVVARIEIDYRSEVALGTEYVESRHELEAVGRSSVTLRERLTDPAGTTVAEARVVIVVWDSEEHKPRRVSAAERAALHAI